MRVNELSAGRQWLIRLETDGDLYGQILAASRDLGVKAATLTVLGAVQRATLRSYDQSSKTYRDFELDEELELLGGTGNISMKDGETFLHCHVTLGTADGRAYGGHLHETKPTVVFVGEVWMQELLGEPPVRLLDERCGLALWS